MKIGLLRKLKQHLRCLNGSFNSALILSLLNAFFFLLFSWIFFCLLQKCDLFVPIEQELKEKEGIESIDDILRQVVKPDGMSFNGISPIYRELLLKLAMSMSKDEIFIRSKNIMNEEKVRKRDLLIMGGSRLLSQNIRVGICIADLARINSLV